MKLKDGKTVKLDAWVIVGSPKFAPELVNIVTLDDLMFDVGVRYHKLAPKMYDARTLEKTERLEPGLQGQLRPRYPADHRAARRLPVGRQRAGDDGFLDAAIRPHGQ